MCLFSVDMIRRRVLRTRSIKMLVLDEADEMLNKGFKEQIYDVYRYLPPATQVVLISATLPHEILEMTSKFMTDPIRILVKRLVYKLFLIIFLSLKVKIEYNYFVIVLIYISTFVKLEGLLIIHMIFLATCIKLW